MVHTDHTVGSNVRSYPMVRAMGDRSTTRGGGGGGAAQGDRNTNGGSHDEHLHDSNADKGLLFPDVRRGMVAVRCHHRKSPMRT